MNKPPVGASVLLGSLWKSLITHFQPMSYFCTIYRNGTLTLNVDQTLNCSSLFLVIKQFSISSGIVHFKFQITYFMKLKSTLMQIWKSINILSSHKNIMLNVSHYNKVYFLRYTRPRYMKSLFTNIQKQ